MGDYDYCKKHDTSFLMPELLMCPYCALDALANGAVPEPHGDALKEAIRIKDETIARLQKRNKSLNKRLQLLKGKV